MNNPQSQEQYWNTNLDAANLGSDVSDSAESLQQELRFADIPDIRALVDTMNPRPGATLLEIGSGLGANATLMARQGANVIALDLSHDRLVALRARTADLLPEGAGRVWAVKAKAEALPFRDDAVDGAYSRAVLIHTELDRATKEIVRTIKPGAPVAFSEPMAHNPLVNLYRRTLAPAEWRSFTTYFTPAMIASVTNHLQHPRAHRFYLLGFLAFVFQYAWSRPRLFYWVLRPLLWVDAILLKLPGVKNLAWFTVMTGRKPHP